MEAPGSMPLRWGFLFREVPPAFSCLAPTRLPRAISPEAKQRHILAKNWHRQSFIQALLHPRCACQLTRPADWGVPLSWGSGVVLGWLGPEQTLHDANCSGPHLWLDHFDIGQWDWGK